MSRAGPPLAPDTWEAVRSRRHAGRWARRHAAWRIASARSAGRPGPPVGTKRLRRPGPHGAARRRRAGMGCRERAILRCPPGASAAASRLRPASPSHGADLAAPLSVLRRLPRREPGRALAGTGRAAAPAGRVGPRWLRGCSGGRCPPGKGAQTGRRPAGTSCHLAASGGAGSRTVAASQRPGPAPARRSYVGPARAGQCASGLPGDRGPNELVPSWPVLRDFCVPGAGGLRDSRCVGHTAAGRLRCRGAQSAAVRLSCVGARTARRGQAFSSGQAGGTMRGRVGGA